MEKILIYTPENTARENICHKTKRFPKEYRVFLAGTIDNGASANWQEQVIEKLSSNSPKGMNLIVFNPRRSNWNANATHEDQMIQIDWEQRALADANHIFLVLLDGSKSPISLLELGLYAKSMKITVFCTKKFYRYDNVYDTCMRNNIELVETTNPTTIARKILGKCNDFAIMNSFDVNH